MMGKSVDVLKKAWAMLLESPGWMGFSALPMVELLLFWSASVTLENSGTCC